MRRQMKSSINIFLIGVALITMLSVTAVVSAQKDAREASETAKSSIDYTLPYPGILPGHPLYSLKMARDRILGWLISDPLKKAEYDLLLADKRFNSGYLLIQYGKQKDGVVTMSKGEDYFTQAIAMAKTAKAKNEDINPLKDQMGKAALKHEEILNIIIEKGPFDIKNETLGVLKIITTLQDQIQTLK